MLRGMGNGARQGRNSHWEGTWKIPEICLVCEGEALGLSRHCRDETRRVQDGWEKEDRCRGLCDHWIKQIFTESD